MSGKARSWRKSVLTLNHYLMIMKSIVKFLWTNTALKEAGKVVLPIFVNQIRIYDFHVKMISSYASVNYFLTHTVVVECNMTIWVCSQGSGKSDWDVDLGGVAVILSRTTTARVTRRETRFPHADLRVDLNTLNVSICILHYPNRHHVLPRPVPPPNHCNSFSPSLVCNSSSYQGRRNVFSLGGGGAKTKKGTVMSKRALTVYARIIITNALMKHHCRHKFFCYMLSVVF